MADDNVSVGEILLGKYRVEQVLGRGGMGLVVAARHVELGELFAIKCLLPHALERSEAVERFLREARTAARLKGLHVAKVYDVGRLETGTPYMVMEHLAGTDLQGLLRRQGGRPLPVGEVLAYVLQVCEAVTEAHALGIVHRDLKPANMFLTHLPNGAPCVKVLDFGISKQLHPDEGWSGDLTQTGVVLGSPLYMSPEQIQAKDIDARSDVWSIGAVLFELLCGRPPYLASMLSELVAKVILEAPPPPAELRPDIPPDLERAVLRCLEKRPDVRYQTVTDLMADLRAIGRTPDGIERTAGPVAPCAAGTPSDAPVAVARVERPSAPAAPMGGSMETSIPPPSVAAASVLPPAPASTIEARRSGAVSTPRATRTIGWFAILVLAVGAAVGVTVLLMSPRARETPAASTSAATAAPSASAPVAIASAWERPPRSKKWWDDIPDAASRDAKLTKLPAPRLRWLRLFQRGMAAEGNQKNDEAQAALREALEVAKKQLSADDPAYLETLLQLARLLATNGKLDDAEKLLREAMDVQAKYGDPSAGDYDDTRQALVAVLLKEGKTNEAKKLEVPSTPPPVPATASTPPPVPATASAPPPAPAAESAPPPVVMAAPPVVKAAPRPVVKAAPPPEAPPAPPDPFAPWATYKNKK